MADSKSTVTIILEGVNKISKPLKGARADLRNFSNGVKSSGANFKRYAVTSTATFLAVGAGIKGLLKLSKEQEQQEARLANVIESTGGAANRTVKQVKDLASEIQDYSTVGDEAILKGQNMLLTFKNIEGANFDRTTKAMVDLAVATKGADATGSDLQSTALQIGKALNDPIKGLSALTRVGITFTKQQEEQIKSMQAMGDIAGAQNIILGELESQFGGAAAAAATGAAQWSQVSNIMGDVGENLGFLSQIMLGEFLPSVTKIAKSLRSITGGAVDVLKQVKKVQKEFADKGQILSFGEALDKVKESGEGLSAGAKKVIEFIDAVRKFKENNPFLFEAGVLLAKIVAIAIPLGAAIGAITLVLQPLIGVFSLLIGVMKIAGAVMLFLTTPIGLMIAAFVAVGVAIFALIKFWPEIKQFFSNIWNFAVEAFTGVKDTVVNAMAAVWESISSVWTGITDFFAEKLDAIKNFFTTTWEFVKLATATWVVNTIASFREMFTGIKEAVSSGFEAVKNFFTNAFLSLVEIVSSGAKKVKDGFFSIISSIGQSALKVFENIGNKIVGFVNLIIDAINKIPGIDLGKIKEFDFSKVSGLQIDGARAKGGPVSAGRSYLVGEEGPEVIVPRSSGTVIPNEDIGSSGGQNFNINITVNGDVDSEGRIEQIYEVFKERLTQEIRLKSFGL